MSRENTDGIWDCLNNQNSILLPIDMLEPYTKIINDAHYFTVIESIKLEGLKNPFTVLQIDEDDWHQQFVRDGGSTLDCRPFGAQIRYRIQCGNHRYYALRDYFKAEVVPCEVYEDPAESMKACAKYRRDKSWKALRPTSLL